MINSPASFSDVWFHLVNTSGSCLVHVEFRFYNRKKSPRSNVNSDIKKEKRPNEKLFCQAHEKVTNSAYLLGYYRQQTHQSYMNALPACLHVTNNVTKIYEPEVTGVLARKCNKGPQYSHKLFGNTYGTAIGLMISEIQKPGVCRQVSCTQVSGTKISGSVN